MKIRIFALVLAVVFLFSSVTAFADDTQEIALGTAGLFMTIPSSYAEGEITAEDTDESQVAYYYSEDSLLDFDVYQWAKAEGETLESALQEEAELYNVDEYYPGEINGIECGFYYTEEEFEGEAFTTLTFIASTGDYFTEVVFWLDGEDAEVEALNMMGTIRAEGDGLITTEGTSIKLGTSALILEAPYTYVAGEITAEDTDESQVAYYYSEEGLVDFDIYQWVKADGEDILTIALDEAEEYDSEEVSALRVNGYTVVYYFAVEEYEGVTYDTLTALIEDGENIVELVFWLDGEDAFDVAGDMILSIH